MCWKPLPVRGTRPISTSWPTTISPAGREIPTISYLGLMRQNMRIMIPALGGNADALADVDVSPVFEGESGAVYPQ